VLTSAPYNLILGQPVNIKVSATNDYGPSDLSIVGNGALIQLVPLAPVGLTNNATATSATQIGFYWSDGASNGGTAIIDYTIFWDQSTNNFVQLASGVTSKSYTTQVTLTEGNNYAFYVLARNAVGLSLSSSIITIKAA